jgi:hypothetical protein
VSFGLFLIFATYAYWTTYIRKVGKSTVSELSSSI